MGCGLVTTNPTCNVCLESSCCEEAQACTDTPACLALLECFNACPAGDAACYPACRTKNPTGTATFDAFRTCMSATCTTACTPDPCAGKPDGPFCDATAAVLHQCVGGKDSPQNCPSGCNASTKKCVAAPSTSRGSGQRMGSGEAAACGAHFKSPGVCAVCMDKQATCCAEIDACATSAECSTLWSCVASCETTACLQACFGPASAEIRTKYFAIDGCAVRSCSVECEIDNFCYNANDTSGGDGRYCGGLLTENPAKASILFECDSWGTVKETACANGCDANFRGKDDCFVGGNSCAGQPNGPFCRSGSGTSHELVRCENGAVAETYSCGGTGCSQENFHTPDHCTKPDPCEGIPAALACGANLKGPTDPDALYWCDQGKTVGSYSCAGQGCHASAAGVPDYCNGQDPCKNFGLDGTGKACGKTLGGQADPNLLYDCKNFVTVGSDYCTNGCAPAPVGKPDLCK